MSRLAAVVAVVATVLGVSSATAQATPPPTPPPPVIVTTAPPTLAPPPTTAPATSAPAPTSTAPVTTSTAPDRAAATDEDDSWSGRGIATVVGVGVVLLALAGFVYGRVRSHHRPATSSALATTATNPPPE